MKGKKKTLFILALLLLVGVTSGYIANTYAKYASDMTSNGTASVAKWNFTKDNKDASFTVKLDETINPATLVAGKIAPGARGSFEVEVSNTSETGVHYIITLEENPEKPIPENLKFYTNDTYATELPEAKIEGDLDAYKESTPSTLPSEETNTKKTFKIYWAWDYESTPSQDSEDTGFGLAAAGVGENGEPVTPTGDTDPAALTISLNIKGEQRNPIETTSESETN